MQICFPVPCLRALRVLSMQLPLILAYLVVGLLQCRILAESDALGAWLDFQQLVEYIGVSLLLAVGTAVLIDLTEREKGLQ